MAQSDRFYFWRGFYDALMTLDTDRERGEFVRGMCLWAFEGEEPRFSDKMLTFAFTTIRDQLSESVDLGRRMAERGRKSGESRRKKSGAEQCSEQCSNTVRTKGKERKGSDLASSASAESAAVAPLAADAARRTVDESLYDPLPFGMPPRQGGG